MFAIRVLPLSQSDSDGQRLGEITIDDFEEQFACNPVDIAIDQMETHWRHQLAKIVRGETVVALVRDPRFAWIIYREGDQCFVQERLSLDGNFKRIGPRKTQTEDGHSVSEWTTTVSAIRQFIDV